MSVNIVMFFPMKFRVSQAPGSGRLGLGVGGLPFQVLVRHCHPSPMQGQTTVLLTFQLNSYN